MARIEIVIEDKPGNKVSVTATPNFETMCKIDLSGNQLTSAHGYAMLMLRAVRQEAKKNDPRTKIYIPRIGHA